MPQPSQAVAKLAERIKLGPFSLCVTAEAERIKRGVVTGRNFHAEYMLLA
jgi:hypothetical protein